MENKQIINYAWKTFYSYIMYILKNSKKKEKEIYIHIFFSYLTIFPFIIFFIVWYILRNQK